MGVKSPYPPMEEMLEHCCFCAAHKTARRFLFVSPVLPLVVCDECVTSLGNQMFHVELQVRGLEDPKVKQ